MIILQRICVHRKSIVNLGFLGSPNRCIDPRETCRKGLYPGDPGPPGADSAGAQVCSTLRGMDFGDQGMDPMGIFQHFSTFSHVNHEKDATVG